ncbi:hypothetical protein [Candidatus Nitrosacidococcus sp. I8]|uniref:hypothetical protein n=1 Tax=Candidatus Nitrosacidococcus sp. I8 TaxID=2942908 RepID=UPI002227099C|nr:hypothetical protein [Candidatus Nitrosacidococcus sp. I8]CAH9019132.1 hypothetical protein NURINAE_01349 [Candidatus Nitrosacidococcus sp. I8]
MDSNGTASMLVSGQTNRPLLPSTVTAPTDNSAFLAIQANMPNSGIGIEQTINGLTAGQEYNVSFDFAATMDNIDTAKEAAGLTASIFDGSNSSDPLTSFTIPEETITSNNGFLGSHSTPTFSGWSSQSFNFTANQSSMVLQFLANGTPAGLPPYALLTNVQIIAASSNPTNPDNPPTTTVSEPKTL